MFDPHDPADLAQLAVELERRTGRPFVLPALFEWPDDPSDPLTDWAVYPDHPAVRHHDRATRTVIDVSFPGDDTYRLFGWTGTGVGGCLRTVDRSGRFHAVGPTALAWVLSRLLERELAGDPEGTP